jgi:hypothetical protein
VKRLRLALALAMVLAVALVLVVRPAHAHKPSDSYLSFEIDGARAQGRWDIAVRDLEHALDLDADGDGKIGWSESAARRAEIAGYAGARLAVRSSGAGCPITMGDDAAIAAHSDGAYVVLRFDAACEGHIGALAVDYRLFFDLDPQHRGLLRIDAGGASTTHTLTAAAPSAEVDLSRASGVRQLARMAREGVVHIWTGYDHVLFLFALLLPSVLRREGRTWIAVRDLRPALFDVLRVVTAFTVAHSITLSLAALEVVDLPSRLVESVIAASVIAAAANNLYPVLRHDRWMAAFVLGLMHGFGFSATLKDLDLPRSNLLVTLFGFNLGVEVGQIAIVLAFVPVAFLARRSTGYRRVALLGGSVAILAVAAVWLVERAFEMRIIS